MFYKKLAFQFSRRQNLTEKLIAANINFVEITAYKTLSQPNLTQKILSLKNNSQFQAKFVVFFSPSGLNAVLASFPDFFRIFDCFKIVAIGDTTAQALISRNIRLDAVSSMPKPESLVETLLNFQ
ncbi:hypothetical protein MHBO_002333 [Bonamia ostreae]|uniref:Tetrapyrrole biosynthesis uroporphyrinogen III synthase domain-containing protein n=1 Tax=Bonamia ostreae TaxID=126728 RepID=A0ABV2AM17_9EUKA